MFKWFKKLFRDERRVRHEMKVLSCLADLRAMWRQANIRQSINAREMSKVLGTVRDIQEALVLKDKKEAEDALGPILYEITAEHLFKLGPTDRASVALSGARYFNDICAVSLCRHCFGEAAVERIMRWRRDCVFDITEAQIDEAVKAIPNAAHRADSEAADAETSRSS